MLLRIRSYLVAILFGVSTIKFRCIPRPEGDLGVPSLYPFETVNVSGLTNLRCMLRTVSIMR